MEEGFLKTLQKHIKTPLFSDEDLKLLFRGKPLTTIHNSLSYHLKQKHIIKFKRGLYSLTSIDDKFHFSKFTLANALYAPSFISFESALSFHGLIPEAVHEVTSACFMPKKKSFESPMGAFSFCHSPVRPFFLGVEKDKEQGFLIANPVRSLFDLVNFRKRLYRKVSDLDLDFRIDLDDLENIINQYRAREILELADAYKKKNIKKLAELLIRSYK